MLLFSRLAGLPRIGRHYYVGTGDNLDFLLRGSDLEDDRRQSQSCALRQDNALFFKGLQTRRGDRDCICARRNGREIKESGAVRDGVAKSASCLVFQDDLRCGDDRARGVGDRGAYRPARKLREYGQLRNRQGRNQ